MGDTDAVERIKAFMDDLYEVHRKLESQRYGLETFKRIEQSWRNAEARLRQRVKEEHEHNSKIYGELVAAREEIARLKEAAGE